MKKCLTSIILSFMVLGSLMVSCKKEPPIVESDSNDIWKFYSPGDSSDTILWDDFEGTGLGSKNNSKFHSTRFVKQVELDDIRKYCIERDPAYTSWYSNRFNGRNSFVAMLETVYADEVSSIIFTDLTVEQDAMLTFRYILLGEKETTFRIVLDESTVAWSTTGAGNSSCFDEKIMSVRIPAGTTRIDFEAVKKNGYTFSNWPNACYLDDISLVYDKVTSIIVTPRSEQKTYINCPQDEKLKIKGYAVRADGVIVNTPVSLSCSNGSIDGAGYFTPAASGTAIISASTEGVFKEFNNITVYENNSCEGSCTIGNVTYAGILSDSGAALSDQDPHYSDFNAKIEFEYPQTNVVTADGFIRLKGKLTPSTVGYGDYDKVLVTVTNGDKERTIYCADKEFDFRLWLPFSGELEVYVCPAKIQYYTYKKNKKSCEGDEKYYNWFSIYKIAATNTHVHTEASDGSTDGRYVYPSYVSQSDSFLVLNATNEALYNLSASATDMEKVRAIHDYVALNCYYDYDSVSKKNERKKQDAVSVIKNRTAVCAGYTALTGAMTRVAGIPSRYITSDQLNHAWNHIYVGNKWYFCDTTWDDPENSPFSKVVYHDYFMLEDFNGVKNDHGAPDQVINPGRSAEGDIIEPELPLFVKEGNIF